ncbi:unnamed protein product [Sphagnum jensenii]|uniref:GATA-type domain-containing protein n=1 Tax=Sphagnum jensenii TaxID=128206 RepID=A0ABP1C0Z2_9BRYO
MDSAAAPLLPAAAFDGSLRKQQQKPLPDAAAVVGGSSFVDVFQIDDLLDFSNEDIAGPIGEADLVTATSSFSSAVPSVAKSTETIGGCLAPCVPEKGTEQQHHTIKPQVDSEAAEIEEESLCIPYDDLEELEWASRFLEYSFPVTASFDSAAPTKGTTWSDDGSSVISMEENLETCDMQYSASKKHGYHKAASPVSVLEQHTTTSAATTLSEVTGGSDEHSLDFCVPGRARSKRSRSGGKKWTSGGILSSTTTSCGGSKRKSAAAAPPEWSAGEDEEDEEEDDDEEEDAVEEGEEWQSGNFHKTKQSTKWASRRRRQDGGGEVLRCTHCQTQKTPQWRTGPLGPKTLCNACGVRYKSGRLLPEYRPASSPAYVPHKHSNSHKKILEMRRQREMKMPQHQQFKASSLL